MYKLIRYQDMEGNEFFVRYIFRADGEVYLKEVTSKKPLIMFFYGNYGFTNRMISKSSWRLRLEEAGNEDPTLSYKPMDDYLRELVLRHEALFGPASL